VNRTRITLTAVAAAGLVLGLAPNAGAVPGPGPTLGPLTRAGCAVASGHDARCFAEYRAVHGARVAAAPLGLSPGDIAAAYALTGDGGAGRTVAIVDAYDDPNAESDLATYRSTYGLPPCTTANGCFHKVNQRGAAGPYPDPDPQWSVEISLDLDAVSAACPQCSITLVEGDGADLASLGAAEDTAVALGATAVSNSYGGTEFTGMDAYATHYVHPGTSIVASSGDYGFGPASFPAVLGNVVSVGGTTLTKAPTTTRGWTEQAWAGATSSCSAYIAKPAWQKDKNCSMRTVADVSAVADPNSGLAVYDTYGLGDNAGWLVVGGTSLSSPLIGAMITRSGHQIDGAGYIYTHTAALYDPVGGSNGYCGNDYLCTGRKGYDAPTGAGSPHGLAAL
jgi:subtilase family serine protease